MKGAFLKLHPRSAGDWISSIENVPVTSRPTAFLKLLADKRSRKGDFAQEIAARITAGDSFQVPGYLDAAIRKTSEP